MPESLILRCPVCGANNRVPESKMESGLAPICGVCKNRLPLSVKPLTITDANFSSEVEDSPVPVLLDLWAPWCGPCQMIAPVIDQIASESAGRLRVGKLNVDDNPVTANRFQVRGIPCLLILRGGREVDRIVGVQPKSEIMRRLNHVTWAAATAAEGRKA
jgi:thioredoxin 2